MSAIEKRVNEDRTAAETKVFERRRRDAAAGGGRNGGREAEGATMGGVERTRHF